MTSNQRPRSSWSSRGNPSSVQIEETIDDRMHELPDGTFQAADRAWRKAVANDPPQLVVTRRIHVEEPSRSGEADAAREVDPVPAGERLPVARAPLDVGVPKQSPETVLRVVVEPVLLEKDR